MATATAEKPQTAKDEGKRKRPEPKAEAKAPKADAEQPKQEQEPSREEWLAALEKASPNKANEKYPQMTNGQVAAVLRYQIATSGKKAGEKVTGKNLELLKAAVEAYPQMKGSLSTSEQESLGTKASANGSKPKGESKPRKPKQFREGTFQNITDDLSGSLCFYAESDPTKKGTPLYFIGQFGDEEFYGKVEAWLKRNKLDADTVQLVTMRGRNARISRGPLKEAVADAAPAKPKGDAKKEKVEAAKD